MTGRHSLVEIRFETKLKTKAAGPEQATSGSGPIDLSLVFASNGVEKSVSKQVVENL